MEQFKSEVLEISPTTRIRSRTLSMYDDLIFRHFCDFRNSRPENVEAFFKRYAGGEEVKSLEQLVNRIISTRGSGVWAEMGGGGAIAMRQVTSLVKEKDKLTRYNVDISDFDDRSVKDIEVLRELAKKTPTALRLENKPRRINADMTSVVLPQKADLITSVASVFYLDKPLEAMCNWYNQLNDGGLLVVTSEETWSDRIRDADGGFGVSPVVDFIQQLDKLAIPVVTNGERFNLMLVEKKPGVELSLKADIDKVWTSPTGQKDVSYRKGLLLTDLNLV